MSDTYVLPTLVKGPYSLIERRLVVNVGWLAVVFRDGVPRTVCGPGRHRSFLGLFTGRRLPATGELSVLLFDTAPQNVHLAVEALRLGDGRRVSVGAMAVVQPRWATEPSILLGVAARYGVLSARYGEAAGIDLYADFRANARRLLRQFGHDDVYLADDERGTLAALPDVPGTGLLRVERFVHVTVTGDRVVTETEREREEAEIKAERLKAKAALQPMVAALDRIRNRFRDEIARECAVRQTRLDVDLAALYGVLPMFLRDPKAAAEIERARLEVISGLLGEYADTIAYTAGELGVTPNELLREIAMGRVPGDPTSPPLPNELDGIERLDDRRSPG
ncbi:hypothetical protein LDL08_02700 [Nonomuraea glycinis]|uniref:SPFH domain-containing protein n=1 Tax=Nonomuraea glycinis TaxID=2047744 RepID=A0A918A1G2_9ACTN|nr:hypothetical protein [Nonomuraea glycinis]MCA2175087.1 hypothetical protein [Nonomuraea glycinis]GGP00912.1 hypothetical protein GCM10012278_02720 [Nonomuraea glycinis]